MTLDLTLQSHDILIVIVDLDFHFKKEKKEKENISVSRSKLLENDLLLFIGLEEVLCSKRILCKPDQLTLFSLPPSLSPVILSFLLPSNITNLFIVNQHFLQ